MADNDRKILSVGDVTRRIKRLIEGEVGNVWVEGEVSNLRKPASGHMYFTLKDETSQIQSVLFRGSQRPGMSLSDGMLVRVYGSATVYERGGNYQIIVRVVEEAGKGDLQKRFEELKKKLQEEGLFEQASKKDLPLLPRHIGVVTSRTGAAIRDILNVIDRRFPNLHIVIAPVKVQGEAAAVEIADAIDFLNAHGGLDVLIVGRGGGSIEDLWAFNEEVVARAIWRSVTPVISAVGHEIDFTIADFVADMRAPTPSAAAELVVGRKDEFLQQLSSAARSMIRILKSSLVERRARFNGLAGSYVFREPENIIKQHSDRLENIRLNIIHGLTGSMQEVAQSLDESGHRLAVQARVRCERLKGRLERSDSALNAMNPAKVLKRGYSITKGEDGKCLVSVNGMKKGTRIVTVLAEGELESTVHKVDTTRGGV